MAKQAETRTVGALTFTFGSNGAQDFWWADDEIGRRWQVVRNHSEPHWWAIVTGKGQPMRLLTQVHWDAGGMVEIGALTRITSPQSDYNATVLLSGIAELAKSNEWPEPVYLNYCEGRYQIKDDYRIRLGLPSGLYVIEKRDRKYWTMIHVETGTTATVLAKFIKRVD